MMDSFNFNCRNYSIFSVFLTKKKKVKVFLIILIGLGFLELCNGANLTDLSKTSSDISLLDSKFFVYMQVCVCVLYFFVVFFKNCTCVGCVCTFNYTSLFCSLGSKGPNVIKSFISVKYEILNNIFLVNVTKK